jgi:Uma2 family endonuclease
MTEQEFVDWCDSDTWAEWVDGEVIVMPAVELAHARITGFMATLIRVFAEDHDLGEVLGEPYQIRFARIRRRRSPDVIFVSREKSKLIKSSGFEGGPDLVIEVVSAESQSRDRREKYIEYAAAGVREYWIIDPLVKEIEVHALGKNKKYTAIAETGGVFHSTVLKGFFIKPQWLWQLKPPKVLDVLGEINRGGSSRR